MPDSVEICAGAGGQSLGLERAGFSHRALVEWDPHCCATLRLNRPEWDVYNGDVAAFDGRPFRGVDLFAGGVPCPPFSVAGKQLGEKDERDLFPEAIRLADEIRPRVVMLENVRGFLDSVFDDYRTRLFRQFGRLGYHAAIRLFHASDFGVPQLRPRVVLIAVRKDEVEHFAWPTLMPSQPLSVGDSLHDLMGARGWRHVGQWRALARGIAPTIVGGSKKHGGPDLGPTRAKRAWAELGVDGHGIADCAPDAEFLGMPRLTVRMVARIQGFPDDWHFSGKKTAGHRQVGNAFPPPVACAVGQSISAMLSSAARRRVMVA